MTKAKAEVVLLVLVLTSRGDSDQLHCIETERQALLSLKQGFIDDGNRLSSCTSTKRDCCAWKGIRCDNLTHHIISLDLHSNSSVPMLLGGEIGPSLAELQYLKYLDLSYNNFTNKFSTTLSDSLEHLDLSRNQFKGPFPNLSNFSYLRVLDVSSNSFTGLVTEVHFEKLSKLKTLYLSDNPLTLKINSTWIPPFQLHNLSLSSCNLGPQFPTWFKTQVNISFLDISNSRIEDSIPNWFSIQSTKLNFLNPSSNKLHGSIPYYLSNVKILDLSYNRFNNLTTLLCEPVNGTTKLLDISNNMLYGTLSDCHWNLKSLIVLKLDKNNLSGVIPRSIGSSYGIQYLFLGHNNFSGNLPSSLKNCTQLRVLDVKANRLKGNIPAWLGERLTNLIFLRLKSNNFYGVIPSSMCHLQFVQIFDLSNNNISGFIPSCIENFTSMVDKRFQKMSNISTQVPLDDGRQQVLLYEIVAMIMWKGVLRQYSRTLGLLRLIDLSRNNLTGEIPKELFNLVELVQLNLSRNNLNGSIPIEIGNLKKIDSLDLSNNKFSGVIPTSLASISSLSFLNLSSNKLSGRIPTGTQLQSFNASTYIDNDGLYGLPLTNSCLGDESPSGSQDHSSGAEGFTEDNEEWLDMSWLFMGFGVGFVVGFVGLCCIFLLFTSSRFTNFMGVSRD
ncbi:receptor-like protein EIX1 [Humulus lupulus]|uniref:receptor-like protein EIX1 n=1 Tax=Humulus lupulus TaxID=3486 RepID=UPI002B40BA08|nr:receptor-like protein EIX1 [Humulus lupulus]